MAYTLGEAARATGISKTSLRRALDAGRISGNRDELGRWQIEPAELHRVYPPASTLPTPAPEAVPGPEPGHVSALEREVALLRELLDRERAAGEAALAREREINRDLAAERDSWREQATRLLPPQQRPWWRFWH
jgi:hypothetical protein